MRVYVDLETNKVILAPGVTAEASSLRFKRAAAAKLEVQFVRDRVVEELPNDATGTFGIKLPGKYDDDYVTAGLAWVKTGSGADTVYSFSISFINTALDALFFVDGNPDNDVPQITLMGELEWTTGGNTLKTPTLAVVVDNDVIRGGETLPEMPAIAYAVFLNGITALTGGEIGEDPITHLDAVPTAGLLTGYIVQVLVDQGGDLEWLAYRLIDGPATDTAPGQVAPLDYDAETNDRHWEGATGPSGPAGASTEWRVGAGAPDNATGVDGDLYLRTSNGDVYQRASGVYAVVANIKGAMGDTGTTGATGSTWRSGSGIPADAVGVDGDFYFRTATSDVFKRISGVYGIIANIRGDTGGAGATGETGTAGKTILSGAGVPGSGTGTDGDFYLDTAAFALYGPKTAGAWGSGTSLIGPQGNDGITGGSSLGARVYNSADISVATSTVQALTFNSERFDTDSIHSTSSNTGRLTCKTAGVYLIWGNLQFGSNATGLRGISVRLNGTTLVADQTRPASAVGAQSINLAALSQLAVNDYLELTVFQTSGGALNVTASANYSPEFGMALISAAPGADGSVWHLGSGVPDNGTGKDADDYLDLDTGDVYLRAGGTYSLVGNIKGDDGEATMWRTGSGIPSDASGVDGDLYFRTSNGAVYKKVSGTYGAPIANLTGPAGDDGAAGTDGADGEGVPTGGTTRQVLSKIDGTDFNTEWSDPAEGTGVPDGGTTGQILTKLSNTDGDADWASLALPTDISARVYNNADESIADSTEVALAFNSARFDTGSLHSSSINNSRLTCATAGKYVITTSVRFASNSTGRRQLTLRVNGTAKIAQMVVDAVAGSSTDLTVSTIYNLAAGDYVEAVVFQNSGGGLDVSSVGNVSPEFGMGLLKAAAGSGGGSGATSGSPMFDDAGSAGELRYDADYLYLNNGTEWRRIRLISYGGVLVWVSNGDSNGLFYHIGSQLGAWQNPHTAGYVAIGVFNASDVANLGSGTLSGVVNRDNTDDNGSANNAGSYWKISLPEGQEIAITDYTFRARPASSGTDSNPTNWTLQGSNDDDTWTDIDVQDGVTYSVDNEWKHFVVAGAASYRFHRFVHRGNVTGVNNFFFMSELELYGNYRSE